MLRSLDRKDFVEQSKILLRDYLDGWLKTKIDVSPKTLIGYRFQLGYFRTPLGGLRLQEVSTQAVQRVLSGMLDRGLSRRTLEYARAVLHAALVDAVRGSLIVKNPADHTRIPPKVKRAPTVLTSGEVAKLLEATKGDQFGILWRLLLTTGLRPQEALALHWEDIDFDQGWLSVRRVLADDGTGKSFLRDSTKTQGSTRRIGLPVSTVEALRELKDATNRLLVFANAAGFPLDHSKVRRKWKAALNAVGLPSVRLYDTRHTHLTELLKNGADIAWIAARAGHRSVALTIEHYAFALPEVHRSMGEMTEAILQRAYSTLKQENQNNDAHGTEVHAEVR